MNYLALLCATLIGVVIGSFAFSALAFRSGYVAGFEEFRSYITASCEAVQATCNRDGATFADLMQSLRMMTEALNRKANGRAA